MIRALARTAILIWTLACLAASGVILARHPFAAPMVERTGAEARAALARAVAATVSPEWLAPRLAAAVAEGDADAAALHLELAAEHGIALPEDLHAEAEALVAARGGTWETAADCAACAWDITACRTLAQIGACAIPVELSPLGDLNALRRAGTDWITGAEVDEVEAGLALVGLAATGAILVSGGTSLTLKAGATALRMARRTGALTPGLGRALADAGRGLIRWQELPAVLGRRVPVETAVDQARWAALGAMAADIGRIAARTSPAEALTLLRHAEDGADLARLARLAEAAGPDTRKSLAVLGKARAFRTLARLSDLALAAVGALALLAAQVGALLASAAKLLLRRALGPGRVAKPRRSRP